MDADYPAIGVNFARRNTEYRTEIAAEFEAYFMAVSNHIACLDSERSRALSEAHMAAEAYSTFLNTSPAQKDLP